MNELSPLLQQWANFCVSMSQAGAALIGLMFVVITVAAERRPEELAKIRVYLTPTVVYLASVVGVSELLTVPTQTRLTATLCISLVGLAGLVYAGICFVSHGKKGSYYTRGDRVPYAVIPFMAFALLVCGGILVNNHPERALTFVAAALMSLLALGIRNSWSIVVDVVSARRGGHS